MEIREAARAVGTVHITARNADGSITFDKTFKNQLTNYARTASASFWAGAPVIVPSQINVGIGSSSAGPAPSDTALWYSFASKNTDYATVWLDYNTQYSATYEASEAVGTWTELGLFDSLGNMWSHVVVNFVKDNQSTVTVQWQVAHYVL